MLVDPLVVVAPLVLVVEPDVVVEPALLLGEAPPLLVVPPPAAVVEPAVVLEPPPVVVASLVVEPLSADPLVVDPVVLVLVLVLVVVVPLALCVAAVVPSPAESEPESPSQPASEITKLPINAIQTIRPDPNPRSAFLMRPPNVNPSTGPSNGSHQSGRCTSTQRSFRLLFSRGGDDHPGNPAVIGPTPLDRKFCAPVFRRVCRYAQRCDPAARWQQCSQRASFLNALIMLDFLTLAEA